MDALEEIQTEYPPVAKLDVAMLCDLWLSGESCEMDFEQGGLSFAVLGFKNKCDFATHKGYRVAQEQLALLRPRWIVCNVPRDPECVKVAVDMDEKESAKIRKYQRVVRHLLFLSRQALENDQEVVWLSHPSSKVWKLPEVLAFWKANGPLMLGNETVGDQHQRSHSELLSGSRGYRPGPSSQSRAPSPLGLVPQKVSGPGCLVRLPAGMAS